MNKYFFKKTISSILAVSVAIVSLGLTSTITMAAEIIAPTKQINSFGINANLGLIDEVNHIIKVTLPLGTDLKVLAPKIVINGASVSPASDETQDFTNPIIYTVTASDSTIQQYAVIVTIDQNSDASAVAGDKDALKDESIKGLNVDLANITEALSNPLPATGSNGSTITWKSSDRTVVSDDGQTIVRPRHGYGDITEILTATITKGAITDTKSFTLKVLELPSSVATISSKVFRISSNGTPTETITNVPYGKTKEELLAGLAKDEPNQTWNTDKIRSTVMNGDKVVVTSADGKTTISYIVTVIPSDKKPVKVKAAPVIVEPFLDTANHWAYDYIESVRLKGVIQGIGNRKFGPDLYITRGEMTKIAVNLYGADLPTRLKIKSFSDVEITDQYAPYIDAAKKLNLIRGYKDGTFKPNEVITRGDALKLLLISAKKQITPEAIAAFTDTNDHSWYSSYINYAKAKGIIIGYKDGTFRPDQLATRAEFLKIISRIYDLK